MSNINYACIKDTVIINIILFDSDSLTEDLLKKVKEEQNLDYLIPYTEQDYVKIGGTYINNEFIIELPEKPYPSWIFNYSTYSWESPILRPIENPSKYEWDESIGNWVLK